jgi:hypothetical protein
VTSMEGGFLCLAMAARNLQRRPVLSLRGRPARASEGKRRRLGAIFRLAAQKRNDQSRSLLCDQCIGRR